MHSDEADPSVACDFLDLYLDDLDAGRLRSLSYYQERFPGHENSIAEQFAALERDAAQAPPTAPPTLPQVLAERYRLLKVVGRGGQGVVYLADDLRLQRHVALKILDGATLTTSRVARLRREAEAVARLDHPGLCPVLDAQLDGPHPYISMRYIEGDSLADRIRALTTTTPATTAGSRFLSRLPQTTAEIHAVLQFIERAARALHAAHESGVIHRDVKPANLMIDAQDQPILLDFGLAREEASTSFLTQSGDLFGTLAYMSPEQLAGNVALDRRTDVYSLGLTLFECLTLQRPFGSVDREALSRRVRGEAPPDLARFNPALGRDVRIVVGMALERDRDRRYPTALAFAADLRRIRLFEPIEARPAGALLRLRRWAQRHPTLAATTTLALLSLSVLLIVISFAHRSTSRSAAQVQEMRDAYALLDLEARVRNAEHKAASLSELAVRPERAADYRAWFDYVQPLLDAEPRLRAALADRRSPTPPDAKLASPPAPHPRHAELDDLRAELTARRRAQDVREGRAEVGATTIDDETRGLLSLNPPAWNSRVWQIVHPSMPQWDRLAEGLAMARVLHAHAAGHDWKTRAQIADTLAWALCHNGLDQEALATANEALAGVPTGSTLTLECPNLPKAVENLRQSGRNAIAELKARIAELEDVVRKSHDGSQSLIADIGRFRESTFRRMQLDLAWAESVHRLSVDDHDEEWQQAREAIRTADGVVASELYVPGRIDLRPQVGLVPIGMNPASRLWEFYDLRSAATGSSLPQRGSDGRFTVTDDTGIIFALLPGGRAFVGSQWTDPAQPLFEPDRQASEADEAPRIVTIEPIFLATHELTQAQFGRLAAVRSSPSHFNPSFLAGDHVFTARHPVETVSWVTCRAVLHRSGLRLPTEDEWEYACRAGASTAWSTGAGPLSLQGLANILDESLQRHSPNTHPGETYFDDGFKYTAPVGTYRPNGFGLYDMHGNVQEWCEDSFSPFESSRVVRGGSWKLVARTARAANRAGKPPGTQSDDIGVRAARRVER